MRLLSTKILSPNIKSRLIQNGISVTEYSLIKIKPLILSNYNIQPTLIFTSQNAVKLAYESIKIKNKIIGKKSFCVGLKTKTLLEKLGQQVVEMRDNANDLADFLNKNYKKKSFSFFCGRKRRPEIEYLFKQNNITIEIHELYDTLFFSKRFKNHFDGIIFFSPSAVLSFFEKNKWPKDSHGFCIGKSTGETLGQFTSEYSQAKHPNEDKLLLAILNFFSIHHVKK